MTSISELLAEAGVAGMTRQELLSTARARIRETYTDQVLARELARLGDRVIRDGLRLRLADSASFPLGSASDYMARTDDADGRLLRIVVFDIETIVEPDSKQPDQTLRTIYQIALRRVGSDATWISELPSYSSYVSIPEDKLHLVRRTDTRKLVDTAQPPHVVFTAVASLLLGADVIVSYNGTGFDFDSLHEAFHHAGLPKLRKIPQADALLLAVSLYELPRGSTLALMPLAKELGWKGSSGVAHDAIHDADTLVWLLGEMATEMRLRLPSGVLELVTGITAGSPAWNVLRALGEDLPVNTVPTAQQIRSTVQSAISSRTALRGALLASAVDFIPTALRSTTDTTALDLSALLRAKYGDHAEAREGQRRMVEILRLWSRGKRSGLLEAPTGVGKSDALLTTALEWLAADPNNRVLISTFTKQLQSQLREDIGRLDRAGISGLLAQSDVVKGKGSRLSLRALLFAIEDLVGVPAAQGHTRTRSLARDVHYREFVAYLLLRFLAVPAKAPSEWLRMSVDTQDFHPFLSDYMELLSYYTKHLSQALAGEMTSDPNDEISAHTSSVREALRAHRLVIVNHALLFANLEDITDIGPHTLLLLDEAHVLEGAATDALAKTADISSVDSLVDEFDSWSRDQPDTAIQVHTARSSITAWAQTGKFRATVRNAFAALPVEEGTRRFGRKLILASPLEGTTSGAIRSARFEISAAAEVMSRAKRAVASAPPGRSRIDEDRRSALESRLRDIVDNLYDISLYLAASARDADSNWLVWAEEQVSESKDLLYETAESFKFRLVAAPLEVARHPDFIKFTQQTFPAIIYVSATLKVTNSFDFIRSRLGLSTQAVAEAEVATSFDFAKQARLVAFSDFPSWQEQVDSACRSIAQQVHVFEQEVGDPGSNGVIVMTTARATAASVGDYLGQLHHKESATYAIHQQIIRGTGQSVRAFGGDRTPDSAEAGVLIGTKGLWQGVNVENPDVLKLIWINKLPFASPAEPLIAARMAVIARKLAASDAVRFADPVVAMEEASRRYYLPLGAIELRQAVGRLIRTEHHRGVIIISDRKLDGPDRWRRRNREFFLGSLDAGLLRPDPETGEANGAGNVMTMAEGWREIWEFFAAGPSPLVTPTQLATLVSDEALDVQTQLPEVRNIRALRFSHEEWDSFVAAGTAADMLVSRCEAVGRELSGKPEFTLKSKQKEAISAIARGDELLALLPTSFGKSYIYQLSALVLPGVTVVVSPLVALMTDQARSLNRSIGNAVRALVSPMRESNSRSGKQEVIDQLRGIERGISLIYLSPERLASVQFQGPLRDAVRGGHLRLIALDEAHTFVTWGDDFRPSFRRAANFLRELRAQGAQIIGMTATAKDTVREGLVRRVWSPSGPRPFTLVAAPPTRANLALYARDVTDSGKLALIKALAGEMISRTLRGHTVVYTLTIKEAKLITQQLRMIVGESEAWRIELFHGQLPPDAKSRILDKFKEAPDASNEAEFEPLIIVATGAFGLGVDRKDVRAVLVASPPTDLSGLFQQIGRAGRDPNSTAWGMMVATDRSLNLIEWLISKREGSDISLVDDIASRLLAFTGPEGLDINAMADALINEDPSTNAKELSNRHSAMRILILQLVAELDEAGVLEDLGDWPDFVRIDRGSLDGQTADTCAEASAILSACTTPYKEPLGMLWRALSGRYSDPGALLTALLDLHSVGALEMSQAPMTRSLTGLRHTGMPLPNDLSLRLQRPLDSARAEYGLLRAFFSDSRCRHVTFAEYFNSPAPVDVCLTAETRCDRCWQNYRELQTPPEMYRLFTAEYRAHAAPFDERQRQQLSDKMSQTLRMYPQGMTAARLKAVISGADAIYRRGQPPRPLPRALVFLPTFGSFQGISDKEFDTALGSLLAQNIIVGTEQQRPGYTYTLLQHASVARPTVHKEGI